MEVMQQITIDEWMSWKEDIRRKLTETARNFVYIGYRLKQIRDSGMYDGAEDIYEFALKEYGLSKGTVSRFIAINEKFSEDGNSLELKKEYRAIGSSKLAEMLTLTDEECRLITEKTTVSQIREFKRFSRQEPEDGDDAGSQSLEWTALQKCIIEYFRGKKEMLDAAMECIAGNDYKQAAEIISPNGNTTFNKGIIFLFMYDYKEGVKYRTFGRPETTVMSWEDFIMEICMIFWPNYSMGINGYDALYGAAEILNGDGFVATSQQEKKEDKKHVEKMEDEAAPESGTEKKDGAPGESTDAAEQENDEDGAGGEVEDPDVVYMGKCSVADIVMGIPEPTKEELEGAGDNQIPVKPYDEEKFEDEIEESDKEKAVFDNKMAGYDAEEQIRGYKLGIKADMEIMDYRYEKEDWAGVIKKAEDIIWRVEQIWKAQKEEECE